MKLNNQSNQTNKIYDHLSQYLRDNKYDIRAIGDAVSWEETCWLEFKMSYELSDEDLERGDQPHQLYFNICQAAMALANSHGGLLIIGIDDQYKQSGKVLTYDQLGRNMKNPTWEAIQECINNKVFHCGDKAYQFQWKSHIKSNNSAITSVTEAISIRLNNLPKLKELVHFKKLGLGGREVVGILVERVDDSNLISFERIIDNYKGVKGETKREQTIGMIRKHGDKVESVELDLNLSDQREAYLISRTEETDKAYEFIKKNLPLSRGIEKYIKIITRLRKENRNSIIISLLFSLMTVFLIFFFISGERNGSISDKTKEEIRKEVSAKSDNIESKFWTKEELDKKLGTQNLTNKGEIKLEIEKLRNDYEVKNKNIVDEHKNSFTKLEGNIKAIYKTLQENEESTKRILDAQTAKDDSVKDTVAQLYQQIGANKQSLEDKIKLEMDKLQVECQQFNNIVNGHKNSLVKIEENINGIYNKLSNTEASLKEQFNIQETKYNSIKDIEPRLNQQIGANKQSLEDKIKLEMDKLQKECQQFNNIVNGHKNSLVKIEENISGISNILSATETSLKERLDAQSAKYNSVIDNVAKLNQQIGANKQEIKLEVDKLRNDDEAKIKNIADGSKTSLNGLELRITNIHSKLSTTEASLKESIDNIAKLNQQIRSADVKVQESLKDKVDSTVFNVLRENIISLNTKLSNSTTKELEQIKILENSINEIHADLVGKATLIDLNQVNAKIAPIDNLLKEKIGKEELMLKVNELKNTLSELTKKQADLNKKVEELQTFLNNKSTRDNVNNISKNM